VSTCIEPNVYWDWVSPFITCPLYCSIGAVKSNGETKSPPPENEGWWAYTSKSLLYAPPALLGTPAPNQEYQSIPPFDSANVNSILSSAALCGSAKIYA
jgi:hypothetical protein